LINYSTLSAARTVITLEMNIRSDDSRR